MSLLRFISAEVNAEHFQFSYELENTRHTAW
jgi:hypothetical protein